MSNLPLRVPGTIVAALLVLTLGALSAPKSYAQKLRSTLGDQQEDLVGRVDQALSVDDPAGRIVALDAIIQSKPDPSTLPFIYQAYALTYLAAKDNDKTIEFAKKVLATNPNDADALSAMLTVAVNKKDYDTVVSCLPGLVAASKAAGDTEYAKQNRDEAAKTLPFAEYQVYQAIAQAPDSATQVRYAGVYLKTLPAPSNPDEANRAAIVGQAAAQGLVHMEPAAAISAGEELLAAAPDNLPLLLTMGGIYAEHGRGSQLAKGMEDSRHAIQLLKAEIASPPANAPPNWQQTQDENMGLAWNQIGQIQMKRDETGQAIDSFVTARKLLEGNRDQEAIVLYWLGFAYAKVGMRQRARSVLGDCIQLRGRTEGQCRQVLMKVMS
jgi:tetratricopeptide (TPR) repeat protein